MGVKPRKIGVLTSGGDGPGMNAAIRSVVRYGLHYGLQVDGIFRGFDGLLDDEVAPLNHRSVASIIDRGGTILKTARSPRFKTLTGQKRAVAVLKKHGIEALVVIGGDGSYRGAYDLATRWQIPTVGVPGTIDNDLCGTDQTIGCHTAVNTALEAMDKIRDTAHSMERIFIVEVMGNQSGYIALQVALGAGAEEVLIPEKKIDYARMAADIRSGYQRGKVSWMIVAAEGAGKANEIAAEITKKTKLETRFVVLGHIQRGGIPTAPDRILATRLGAAAVDVLLHGKSGLAVGTLQDKIHTVSLKEACQKKGMFISDHYRLMKILT